MSALPTIAFSKPGKSPTGVAIIFAASDNKISKSAREIAGPSLDKALAAADFKGKANAVADILAPAGTGLDRLIAVGAGKPEELGESAWLKLGGTAASNVTKN